MAETVIRPTGIITQCYCGGSRKGQGWWIKFAYNRELIDELKASINYVERDWDKEKGEWWISVEAEGVLKRLFPNFEAYKNQLDFKKGE